MLRSPPVAFHTLLQRVPLPFPRSLLTVSTTKQVAGVEADDDADQPPVLAGDDILPIQVRFHFSNPACVVILKYINFGSCC